MTKNREWIAVIDFGSQYTQLIARRIRDQKVYSEIVSCRISASELKKRRPAGIILSGGPSSVYDTNAPECDPAILKLGIPTLGICYGMQLIGKLLGGRVRPGKGREYGHAKLTIRDKKTVFQRLPGQIVVWMSHGDQVEKMPPGFKALASTATCPIAAMADFSRQIYGIQFHPEVIHTPQGTDILRQFVFSICKCKGLWETIRFIKESIETIRKTVGKEHVVCGLSGGVDSSVVALLLHRAIGLRLHCIFVDNGLLRLRETEQVEKTFRQTLGLDLHVVNAASLFLNDLKGITDPELKRKRIGKRFIDVFTAEARKLTRSAATCGNFAEKFKTTAFAKQLSVLAGGPTAFGQIKYLAQGTLYPDVIESSSPIGGPSATIKSHHNVGGLPKDLKWKLIEPLRELFKDEVRAVGRKLGLPDVIINRQPFPGPGLAVRIVGEITAERVAILQNADLIVQEEITGYKSAHELWQSFAVLLPVKSVGVMGDGRTYENVCVLRAVTSQDGMTADWARLPSTLLARISNRIINEVKGINRVVYDISSKPPATIEWE